MKRSLKSPAIRTMKDGREIVNDVELRRRRYLAWERDEGKCILCGQFVPKFQATTEHIIPRGIGGGTRSDVLSNLAVSHYWGNMARGSIRLEVYLQRPLEERIKLCKGMCN